MKKEEFLKLQIGLYVTDHQDTSDPSNYCRITAFKGDRIQLQGYERHGVPVKAHPFWMSYRDLNITGKLFSSEYYALSRR